MQVPLYWGLEILLASRETIDLTMNPGNAGGGRRRRGKVGTQGIVGT